MWRPALLLLTPHTAWAGETVSLGGSLARMSWALLVVVGLILVLYALARKRLFSARTGSQNITIVEVRPVTPKATLVLVEVRGRILLLGLGNSDLRLLADLSAATEAPQPVAAGKDTGPTSPDFAAILAQTS